MRPRNFNMIDVELAGLGIRSGTRSLQSFTNVNKSCHLASTNSAVQKRQIIDDSTAMGYVESQTEQLSTVVDTNNDEDGIQESQCASLKYRPGPDIQQPKDDANCAPTVVPVVHEPADVERSETHDEMQYPKGIKLAVVALSLGLALLLFGLVRYLGCLLSRLPS